MLSAANRVGKTFCGAEECAFQLTGLYPDWWDGIRLEHPLKVWGGGQNNDKARDICQAKLLGKLRRRLGGRETRLRVRRLDRVLNRFLGERRVERQFVLWNVPPAWVRHLRNRSPGAA